MRSCTTFHPPLAPEEQQPDAPPALGRPGQPLRALAFSGGGYNTALQLGVAHALLVSRGREPHIVVGVSAGSINAVALAEILQAGGSVAAQEKLPAQVARFRQILEAYRAAPSALFRAILPDPYEVSAAKPLAPAQLPIHATQERIDRQRATAARAGLIRLANDLLRLRITVRTGTRMIRAVLGLQAAVEVRPRFAAVLAFLVDGCRLWWVLATQILALAPMAQRIVAAVLGQTWLIVWLTTKFTEATGGSLFVGGLKWLLGMDTAGTAGDLIFRTRVRRWIASGLRYLVGLFSLTLALIVVPFLAPTLAFPRPRGYVSPMANWILRRLFASYDVADGILDPHSLRELFVRLFDPDYYGTVDMQGVVENALRDTSEQARNKTPAKRLSSYWKNHPPIRVGPIAVDMGTGKPEVLGGHWNVVDALLAATAVPPAFGAVRGPGGARYYVDASIVSNEPTGPLVEELRGHGAVEEHVPVVHVYPVAALPLSRTELADCPEPKEFTELMEIAARSLLLQRFRDATLDRRMTELYSNALPVGQAVCRLEHEGEARQFVRAFVYPIEPPKPPRVNERVFVASNNAERRKIILEAVADGCRSALEAMIRPSIEMVASMAPAGPITCRAAIRQRLGMDNADLPGANTTIGPGVADVCRECNLFRGEDRQDGKQRLSAAVREPGWPVWPMLGQDMVAAAVIEESNPEVKDASLERMDQSLQAFTHAQGNGAAWPRCRPTGMGAERPLVNLVFSGGVFRGVFLMGVVNALNELGIQPDVIAGSSVGSISAAMTARVFSIEGKTARQLAIANLAATFLAIDRIVLTDRFADFVRSTTLRAAEADFSLRHLDLVFRTYDQNSPKAFARAVRRVLAGLERLVYVNPFEVRQITEAVRGGRHGLVVRLLREFAQEWLERGGVGLELLGAEPLELLIAQHVVANHPAATNQEPRTVPMDLFLSSGIFFMATATNLTRGRLEILGPQQYKGPAFESKLMDALLASSAFPGVFRPRWSWEVMPRSRQSHQYIDGGVMDNLPLDAVAYFLDAAAQAKLISSQPRTPERSVPHLVFTASLEVDASSVTNGRKIAEIVRSWWSVAERAAQLSYNRKLDSYQAMQRHLRFIRKARRGSPGPDELLDLEVVAVKPEWLCSTFGFHPMLGFRRKKQAESIAHGCAQTLRTFRAIHAHDRSRPWLHGWNVSDEAVGRIVDAPSKLNRDEQDLGRCWFRKEETCPFSRQGLLDSAMPTTLSSTIDELNQIYTVCGRASTHKPA